MTRKSDKTVFILDLGSNSLNNFYFTDRIRSVIHPRKLFNNTREFYVIYNMRAV